MPLPGETTAAQPIVIKRVVRRDGAHGGSWKVAFADFAVAMMAFFLLLWLMGSTSEEEKAAIAEFFDNPSAIRGASAMPPPARDAAAPEESLSVTAGDTAEAADDGTPGIAAEIAAETQVAGLVMLRAEFERALQARGLLADYAEHLVIDTTPGGLEIQVVDRAARSMFPLGSDAPTPFARTMLAELATSLAQTDHVISISGHTDALPVKRSGYSNWELSTDRANAARRALVEAGLAEDRVAQVVGLAATTPLDEDNPEDAVNRRISILVMSRSTLEALRAEVTERGSVQ